MTADAARPADVAGLPRAEFAFPGCLRDRLVAAILDGSKTSTTGLALEYEREAERLPRAGDRSALVDSDDCVVAILQVTSVRVVPLAEVVLTDHLSKLQELVVARMAVLASTSDGFPAPLHDQAVRPLARRVTAEEKALMAELYDGGLDAKTIAAVLGLHRTTVTQYLRQSSVTLRRQGISGVQLAEAVQLYADGWSTAQLGKRYDCNPETVRQTLKRAGVTMRPRRGWPY